MDPKKIRDALMIDEDKLQEEMLQRLQAHIGLDSRGHIHIREPTRYRQKDAIALYLIGARYASEAGLREVDSATLSEVSQALGVDTRIVAARLAELREEGKAESPARGEYRIVFARVPWIVNELKANSGARER